MTERKQALKDLRDKVAGGATPQELRLRSVWCQDRSVWCHELFDGQFYEGSADDAYEAFHGSLDAAMALHEAVLPGWIWGRQQNGAMWVAKRPYTSRVTPTGGNLARAWLLCILNALIEQEDADHMEGE